jgi:hypothetical protein
MKPDDFRRNVRIVMTGPKLDPSMCSCHQMNDPALALCGDVLRVDAVNLPFVAVQDLDGDVFALDTRRYAFVKANVSYFRSMAYANYLAREGPSCPHKPAPSPQVNGCPGCGGKMVQRRVASGTWAFRCGTCEP